MVPSPLYLRLKIRRVKMIATAWSALARCAVSQESLASEVDDPIGTEGTIAIIFGSLFVVAAIIFVGVQCKKLRQ